MGNHLELAFPKSSLPRFGGGVIAAKACEIVAGQGAPGWSGTPKAARQQIDQFTTMKNATIAILLALIFLAAGAIGYQFGAFSSFLGRATDGREGKSTAEGAGTVPEPSAGIVAMGRIEPSGGVIDISATVGDRIDKILVSEGDLVDQGAVLARLHSRAMRKLQYEAAEAQLAEAEARCSAEARLGQTRVEIAALDVDKAKTIERDIEAQQAKIELAKANLALARKDLDRLAKLKEQRAGLVSNQEWDRQKLVVDQAEAELNAANAMFNKLKSTLASAVAAAEANRLAAEATKEQVLASIPVRSLEKQRDLARLQYEQTEIKAPQRGKVLKVFLRDGETIGPTPILQMADVSKIAVVAEVYETYAKEIEKGQEARITSRAFDLPKDKEQVGLRGTVSRVAEMITAPALRDLDPTAAADQRVVQVRIDLDEESSAVAATLINLQVDVTILPTNGRVRSSAPPQKP